MVARTAYARAVTWTQANLGADPAWADRYTRAEAELEPLYARVLHELNAADAGLNPLGIEDSDLPLYFLGDQIGPGGKFAAVSDFLIGTGPGSTAWAPALVSQANSALVSARTAYLAKLDRQLAIQEAGAARDARVAAVKQSYGAILADLCGRPTGVATGDLLDWEAQTGSGSINISPRSARLNSN